MEPQRTQPRVAIQGLTHRYGRQLALDHVDLDLPTGVTGLLGPNGAGKTTLLKLIATAMPVRGGTLSIDGVSVGATTLRTVRRRLGYLPQRFEVMGQATVSHNVAYAAWAHGMTRVEIPEAVGRALALVDLTDRADVHARSLSGGMRQRLGLACATVHRPQLLVLDEPTVGLDPVQRSQLRESIAGAAEDAVVVVSTHLVEDLTHTADRIVILHEGRLRFVGSPGELSRLGEPLAKRHASPLEAGYHAVLDRGRAHA